MIILTKTSLHEFKKIVDADTCQVKAFDRIKSAWIDSTWTVNSLYIDNLLTMIPGAKKGRVKL